jgi:hypothetical protein
MSGLTDGVRLPSTNDAIAPVRIFDADGHLVCVVSADEFRRSHPIANPTDSTSTADRRRPRLRPVALPHVLASTSPAAPRTAARTSSPELERLE